MKYTQIHIQPDTLTFGENPRLPTNLNIPAMRDSIETLGKLLEPVTVWQPEAGIFELIRGHRRSFAILEILAENPTRYAEIFPEGIPAFEVEDVTVEEVVELKLDHTEQQGLSDPHEVQMSANMLFAIRKTEADVAFQLASLIEKINPMKSKAKADKAELEEKLADAKVQGKPKAIDNAEKAIKKHIADYRRGFVQHLHDVYRCPHVVNAALYHKACGEQPAGFEEEYLPRLTNAQVNSLWKAHKEDLEVIDDDTGVPKYNQNRVGPQFSEKWASLVKTEKEANNGDPTPPKPKAMSGKDMKAEVGERWNSVGFCKLTGWHSGDKEVEGLDALDAQYHLLDLVAKEQPDLLEMVITEGKKIEAEQIAADKEATAAAEASASESKETEDSA